VGEPGTVGTAAHAHMQPVSRSAPDAGASGVQVVGAEPEHGSTRAWLVARILLAMGVALFALAALSAFHPVDNPGVQECGGAVPFLVLGRDNRVVHFGDTDEPNEDAHSRQPTCRQRALDEVGRSGRLFVAFVVVTGLGAIVGLVDDHLALKREPRFETLLRELPYEGRARRGLVPRVTTGELAHELPPIEVPEVVGIVVWGLVALVALPLAGGWEATWAALAAVPALALAVVAGVLSLSWLAAAALRLRVLPAPSTRPRRLGTVPVLDAVACSWQGTVRPITGASGVDLFRLRRQGTAEGPASSAVQVLVTVAFGLHLALLAPAALVVATDPHPPTVVKEAQILLIAVVLMVVALGMCRLRTRWRGLPVRPSWVAFATFDQLAPRLVDRLVAIILTLAQPLLRVAVLVVVLQAFGASVPLTTVALVALLGPVMVALAPTPGGSGVVEAATMLLLMLVGGVDPARAAAAALTVRFFTYWLPLAPGLAATRWMGRSEPAGASPA
jgi:uncharacterized membrane protein YbhN (UPF0104 family)